PPQPSLPTPPPPKASPTADDLVWGDKKHPACFLSANADDMTDVLGSTDDLGTLMVLSGDDGSVLWRRTFTNVADIRCTDGDIVVLQHDDLSLSVVEPRSGTVTTTPALSDRLFGVYIGDACMKLSLTNSTSTATALDGTPRPKCKIRDRPRYTEEFGLHALGASLTVGKHAYAIVLDDVYDTRPKLAASKPRRGRGMALHRASKALWSVELPLPLDLSVKRDGGLSIQVTEGPTLVTLRTATYDRATGVQASWMATFNQEDGKLLHATDLRDVERGDDSFLEDGTRLYLSTADGLRVYDSKTGDLVWSTPSKPDHR
ncbi:MAG: hypothetical protein JKY37_33000, partial [Nannocystaceae bacterium]|nr:hypothetical protein [Nannocystaceae bacterium]